MKALERIGGWMCEYLYETIILTACAMTFVYIVTLPRHVNIKAAEFECTITSAKGVDAQCDQYTRKTLTYGVHK